MNCEYCSEPLLPGDQVSRIVVNGRPMHHECGARILLGTLAHVEGRCGCYVPGADEGDPPGMTRRQAATATLAAYLARHRGRVH